ncbi:uncharacterized protein LOC125864182 [Solanum stenotomum]|uniref:uncharacterized protein LOC125864182 n=1 Tax=Solanum stenotomum TaxID=172797 RepID=UPI0020D08016|nr:uncharacterized protein LOC125864182 [Solanum stenotomum]
MWECLEEAYLQAIKDKEFQLKQQLQSVKLGTKTIDEYIKEFKGICDGLAAFHKPVDENIKVINFARCLGLKYKTFRTVMLSKAIYLTLNQYVNALRGFDMRDDEKEVPQQNHNMVFSAQRGRGRGNYSQRRGNNDFNCRGRDFKPAGQGTCSYNSRNGPAGDELPQTLATTNLQNTTDDTLYVDSGASSHMTHNSSILTDLKHYNGPDKIIIRNGSKLDITHVGNISGSGLKLKEVLVVPKINKNLLSVSKLAKDNCCTLEFDETNFVVNDKKTRTLLAKGPKRNGLYALEDNNLKVQAASTHVNGDNVATTHILLDNKSTINLSGTGSDVEEQVECDDPYSSIEAPCTDFGSASDSEEHVALTRPVNEHHQTTTLVDVPVDHQSDNATLQLTTLVDVPVEVLPAPQGHYMITRHKAKEHHLSLEQQRHSEGTK